MADSNSVAGYNRNEASRDAPARSGLQTGGPLVTSQVGQYPPVAPGDTAIFGGPLPTTTGAPGTAGGGGDGDPTVEPGQTTDDFTGLSRGDITDTGAPGTAGARHSEGTGSDSVAFTRPGSYLSGTYASDSVRDDIDGPGNWTEANDSGYATGGPQLPGIAGNEPQAGGRFQPGGGRVLRGGRAVRG
jgi:hypothetical protein